LKATSSKRQERGIAERSLRIEGEMTVPRAAELKRAMLDLLDQPGVAMIDISGVSELDTAGVQLLLFAKQTAQARQTQLRFSDLSPAVHEVFQLLDLFAYFGESLGARASEPPA
jgi:anti-sigma B factor antagonist